MKHAKEIAQRIVTAEGITAGAERNMVNAIAKAITAERRRERMLLNKILNWNLAQSKPKLPKNIIRCIVGRLMDLKP